MTTYIITGPDGQQFQTNDLKAAQRIIAALGGTKEREHCGSTITIKIRG